MRDILIDGLPILDLLEVTPSTSNVATLANCDQSSVSRIYRHVSESLQLGFRKSNGAYRAHRNQELLASLRQATQLLRLQRGPEHLHWVGNWWNAPALAQLHDLTPLPRPWKGEQRTLELLESRVLDLAVVDGKALFSTGAGVHGALVNLHHWSVVPLAHYPAGLRACLADPADLGAAPASTDGPEQPVSDVVVVRSEQAERPAIAALIAQLGQAYRQSYGHLNAIRWP